MTGDARKAQEVFHATLREAAQRASNGEISNDPFWLYRDARSRCVEADEQGLQAEAGVELEEADISANAPDQLKKLDMNQLGIWISAAPEPQRTALALFYLGEFDYEEMSRLTKMKVSDLSHLLGQARRQFQAWLNATFPHQEQLT